MNPYFVIFVGALLLSVVGTPIAQRLAVRTGFVDHPGPRKIHLTPMPLLGGVAIATAVIVSALVTTDEAIRAQVLSTLAGAGLLLLVGILDDRGLLHPQVKFLVAMPVAAILLILSGVRVAMFSSPFSTLAFPLDRADLLLLVDYALTFFWLVGITAAFSILDHMDGLCAGVAAIASAFFLWVAVISGQLLVGPLAAGILGASLGFLFWNFHPARIFMGDGGAMFLGFMAATLGIKIRLPDLPLTTSWMVPILILAVPIFDTTLVTVSRLRRGLIPNTAPGKDHTAHRLANLGLGQRGAVLALYGLGLLGGLFALMLRQITPFAAVLVAVSVGGCALLALVWLEQLPYEAQPGSTRTRG